MLLRLLDFVSLGFMESLHCDIWGGKVTLVSVRMYSAKHVMSLACYYVLLPVLSCTGNM